MRDLSSDCLYDVHSELVVTTHSEEAGCTKIVSSSLPSLPGFYSVTCLVYIHKTVDK